MARLPSSSTVPDAQPNTTQKIQPPEGLISFFILRESGCPFYYRIFIENSNHPDPAILGGFFIALSLFAQEVTEGRLETVTTEPFRYTFYPLQKGLLVLCTAKNTNPILIEKIAKRIVQLFITKYRDQLLKLQPASICAPDLSKQIDQIFGELSIITSH